MLLPAAVVTPLTCDWLFKMNDVKGGLTEFPTGQQSVGGATDHSFMLTIRRKEFSGSLRVSFCQR